MMKAMTKAELHEALKAAGVMFRTKAPKAELEQLLGESGQAKKETKPTTKKNKVGAKATLREMFTKAGVVTAEQIASIAKKSNVQKATVLTAMSDLQNPKYAGSAGALNIEKDGDHYRLTK